VSLLSKEKLRSIIISEINYLNECGCRDEVEDLRVLIPGFNVDDHSSHPHFSMITDYSLSREDNALGAKCPGSYAKTADQLVINPEFAASLIKLLMDQSGSTCPESSARALGDIVKLYNF
jgi:hypothetical protein